MKSLRSTSLSTIEGCCTSSYPRRQSLNNGSSTTTIRSKSQSRVQEYIQKAQAEARRNSLSSSTSPAVQSRRNSQSGITNAPPTSTALVGSASKLLGQGIVSAEKQQQQQMNKLSWIKQQQRLRPLSGGSSYNKPAIKVTTTTPTAASRSASLPSGLLTHSDSFESLVSCGDETASTASMTTAASSTVEYLETMSLVDLKSELADLDSAISKLKRNKKKKKQVRFMTTAPPLPPRHRSASLPVIQTSTNERVDELKAELSDLDAAIEKLKNQKKKQSAERKGRKLNSFGSQRSVSLPVLNASEHFTGKETLSELKAQLAGLNSEIAELKERKRNRRSSLVGDDCSVSSAPAVVSTYSSRGGQSRLNTTRAASISNSSASRNGSISLSAHLDATSPRSRRASLSAIQNEDASTTSSCFTGKESLDELKSQLVELDGAIDAMKKNGRYPNGGSKDDDRSVASMPTVCYSSGRSASLPAFGTFQNDDNKSLPELKAELASLDQAILKLKENKYKRSQSSRRCTSMSAIGSGWRSSTRLQAVEEDELMDDEAVVDDSKDVLAFIMEEEDEDGDGNLDENRACELKTSADAEDMSCSSVTMTSFDDDEHEDDLHPRSTSASPKPKSLVASSPFLRNNGCKPKFQNSVLLKSKLFENAKNTTSAPVERHTPPISSSLEQKIPTWRKNAESRNVPSNELRAPPPSSCSEQKTPAWRQNAVTRSTPPVPPNTSSASVGGTLTAGRKPTRRWRQRSSSDMSKEQRGYLF